MAQNPASAYGKDIACIADADDLFTDATGLDIVEQDAIHAITQSDFLGPQGNGRGIDVRLFLGMDDTQLAAQIPTIAEVLERDDRIDRADIVIKKVSRNGLDDVQMTITCLTSAGPFSITKSVLALTNEIGDANS